MTSIALVGCAHIHTPGFVKRLQARRDVQVKYVWDHMADRAADSVSPLNAQQVDRPEEIWSDTEVEAVVICAETDRHEPLVRAAAAAHKHLFVEKPLGLGAADAYAMAEAIDAAGVLFQTGYFKRGEPVHQFLRAQIRQGSFGRVTRIRHSNCHGGSLGDWFTPKWLWMTDMTQAGVGGFGDLGTHSLDILLWLMGDVERVTASIEVATGRYDQCDEYGEGLLRFRNGALGSLAAGWVDVAHPISLMVSGTEGHAYMRENEFYFKSVHVAGADGKEPWTELPPAWPHAFELFLDAVTGTPDVPLITPHEAAVRSDVMEALYRSAAAQTWLAPTR